MTDLEVSLGEEVGDPGGSKDGTEGRIPGADLETLKLPLFKQTIFSLFISPLPRSCAWLQCDPNKVTSSASCPNKKG